MDQQSFDRIARGLGAAVSRRAGLRSAVAAVLGASAAPAVVSVSATAAAAARKPRPEGPCGNGKRKDNICKTGSDCCTGICKTGLKNKDGKGRCRCVRRGKPCTKDKNCCHGSCVSGICGSSSVSCDVCLSGCTYSTVQAALDGVASGATIGIDAGTWDEDLTVSKSVTLTPCNEPVILRNATSSKRTISIDPTAPLTTLLTIHNITVTTSTAGDGGGIEGFANLTLTGTTKVKDCATPGSGGGISIGDGTNLFVVTLTDDVEVSGNLGATEGSGIYIMDHSKLILTGNAVVKNNGDGSSDGAGVYLYYDALMEMSGNAVISGNNGDIGGGVFMYGGSNEVFTMKENAAITGNTAFQAGGVFVESGTNFFMQDASTISGNTATSGSGGGGVFINMTGTMTMSGTASVRGNSASGGPGGGVAIDSGTLILSGNATITTNTTTGTGGGVYAADIPTFPTSSLTVTAPATITSNTPGNCAGTVSC